MMDSLLAGALGGVSGAAGTYMDQQQKQMEFNMKQQEAQAAQLRKINYARWNYAEQDLYKGSGMVDKSGREYSKKEQQAGETALQPKADWTREQKEKEQTKQRAYVKKETIEREGRSQKRKLDKLSADTVDPETGKRLTEREEIEYAESNKPTASRFQWNKQYEESIRTIRNKKKVITDAQGDEDMSEYQKSSVVSDIVKSIDPKSKEYKDIISDPGVRDSVQLNQVMEWVLDLQADGKSKEEIEKTLKNRKFKKGKNKGKKMLDPTMVDRAYVGALQSKEMIDAWGPAWLTGYQGRGQ